MRRRDFIALLGGAAAAMPFVAGAQQRAMPVIGFLHSASRRETAKRLAAFQSGLKEAGFIEGDNVAVEYRWADGQTDRLPDMAADLVRRQVAVIATPGSGSAAVVAKAATTTIPIVFATGADPVAMGLVASLNRPGGNVTGITSMNSELAAKRLEVLRELVPKALYYFVVVNPASPLSAPFIKDLQAGATKLGLHIDVLHAGTDAEIEAAFAGLPQRGSAALVFCPDAFLYSRRAQIAALQARYAVPAIFDVREYADAGALVSYGNNFLDVMQEAGRYTGRVLKGDRPADLPIIQADKFELVINLKTAKALGVAIPDRLLATADEVIE